MIDTQKRGDVFVHRATLSKVAHRSLAKRAHFGRCRGARSIQRHHTVTHLLHWALHEIVSRDATQKGSYVGPDKLTFDFSSAALTPQQKREVEKLVNEKIAENAPVSWTEIPYTEAKKRSDIQQFFGDKYGDVVRVVQIGGEPRSAERLLDGALRRDACASDGRDRVVPDREGRSDRGGHSTDRSGRGRCGARLGETGSRATAGRNLKRSRARNPTSWRLPAFAEDAETEAMLEQIDARAAHLEKLEAEVREWEKQHAKAARSGIAEVARPRSRTNLRQRMPREESLRRRSDRMPTPNCFKRSCDALKSKFNGPIFLAGAANGRVALDRVCAERADVENSGEQVDSGNRADRWRQRRRPAGECAGVRDRRWQDRQALAEAGAADIRQRNCNEERGGKRKTEDN